MAIASFSGGIQWNPRFKTVKSAMIQPGGSVQYFIDSTILNQIEPYLPFREGTATKSGIIHTKTGEGMIMWKTPYIRAIYFGKNKTGKDMSFDTSRHAKAGKMWCERYKADHLRELEGMVQRKVNEGWR